MARSCLHASTSLFFLTHPMHVVKVDQSRQFLTHTGNQPFDMSVQIDRHEDMLRSCLRAVDALSHVPGVDAAVAFQVGLASSQHMPQSSFYDLLMWYF